MHEVLVNRLGGPSLPRKSVVRLTDLPDMTLDVYCGRKTTMQKEQQLEYIFINITFQLLLPSRIRVDQWVAYHELGYELVFFFFLIMCHARVRRVTPRHRTPVNILAVLEMTACLLFQTVCKWSYHLGLEVSTWEGVCLGMLCCT